MIELTFSYADGLFTFTSTGHSDTQVCAAASCLEHTLSHTLARMRRKGEVAMSNRYCHTDEVTGDETHYTTCVEVPRYAGALQTVIETVQLGFEAMANFHPTEVKVTNEQGEYYFAT